MKWLRGKTWDQKTPFFHRTEGYFSESPRSPSSVSALPLHRASRSVDCTCPALPPPLRTPPPPASLTSPSGPLASPSYLGCSYWNLFDFCIVLAGVLDIFFSSSPIVLRTLRILRPLRSITALPDLKALVCAVTASATDLLCICAFVGFVTITFATIGVSFWKGQFRLRCLDEATGGLAGGVEEFCSLSPGPLTHSCSRGACGPWHSNPNYNFTSFDNLGAAALVIVQVCVSASPHPVPVPSARPPANEMQQTITKAHTEGRVQTIAE